ncbi:hypothetical protein [Streptomyces cucumeris]|uniref:hypothetical protein n=1 Tax=Streptomyces cucumeris TaxID=2962890 RepID=UPI0020C8DC91|nr:hypothetical protein [Streptomyces sp. NEAU-Y11]MCP9205527.1 hypothetical protein [Streptomyces sp. NEAU-Y11]
MTYARPAAPAKFLPRKLTEPYETLLGGEPAHHLIATAHADRVCPPSGHTISWGDVYASANLYPLPWKAALLLEPDGTASPIADHLSGAARDLAVEAGRCAERIWCDAQRLGVNL